MKPTSVELIESISWSLDNKVAPHVADKWGASTLRSVSCLLDHLSARIEAEGRILFDDNADLDALSDTLSKIVSAVDDETAQAVAELAVACATVWRDDGAFPTIGSLSEENGHKQHALDRVVAAVSRAGSSAPKAAVDAIDAYLARHLERERPLFAPAFMKPSF